MNVNDQAIERAAAWRAGGKGVALVTVIATWGSSPRPIGSQLAVNEDGAMAGSISGGCIEGEVIATALDVIADCRPRTLEFGVANERAWEVGLPCGGSIRVFIETAPESRILDTLITGRPVVRVVRLNDGYSTLIRGDAIGSDCGLDERVVTVARRAIAEDASRIVETGKGEFFVHAFALPWRMIIIGAVHIAQVLVRMAKMAGFAVTVVDPRRAFMTEERFPEVARSTDWPDEALVALATDRRTAVIVLSHDPKLDDPALTAALRSEAFYVGALGSHNNHKKRCERLKAQGLSNAEIARIHGPIGLDIGAKSPSEIAVSIIAQVVAVRRAPALVPAAKEITGAKVAAVVLAGGRSSRVGRENKLLAKVNGRPMVAGVVAEAIASNVSTVIVVTGHQAGAVRDALADLPVTMVHNPDFKQGLSTSLKAGLAALDEQLEGAIVCLGDMPQVTLHHINKLISVFEARTGCAVCVPTFGGKRGNPVLWDRHFFTEIMEIEGDVGARHLIGTHAEKVVEVPMDDDGVLLDVDTADALNEARRR